MKLLQLSRANIISLVKLLRKHILKWRYIIYALVAVYLLFITSRFISIQAKIYLDRYISNLPRQSTLLDRYYFYDYVQRYDDENYMKALLVYDFERNKTVEIVDIRGYDRPFKEKINTDMFGVEDRKKVIFTFNPSTITNQNLAGCYDWSCIITSNMSLMKYADAVLLSSLSEFEQFAKGKIAVFYTQESPTNSYGLNGLDNKINYVLNYRRDSPTSSPYGYTGIQAINSMTTAVTISDEIFKMKSKAVAWFVSNCYTSSKREDYVKELQKYISVDIYGNCGGRTCERNECEKMLNTDYYFYLAFENSVCKDYITEKLWGIGYQYDVVPIILKRSIAEAYVPPNSFIAVDDFNTVAELARYLKFLMNKPDLYKNYFEWRSSYTVVYLDGYQHGLLERPWGFCQLCKMLWKRPQSHKTIENFTDWWINSCENDGELVNGILKNSQLSKM